MSIVLNKKLSIASLFGLIEFIQFIQCGDNFSVDSNHSGDNLIFVHSVSLLVKFISFMRNIMLCIIRIVEKEI